MTVSVWFWNDINDELREYDFSYYLTTTTKVWRWSLTFISINLLENIPFVFYKSFTFNRQV